MRDDIATFYAAGKGGYGSCGTKLYVRLFVLFHSCDGH